MVCVVIIGFAFYWRFFFFKPKKAYEMSISDWSSDVCSSDLAQISGDRADQKREQRAEKKENERFGEDHSREVTARNDKSGAKQFLHGASSLPGASSISRSTASPAIATNASCRPDRSMASASIPASPSIRALSSGSTPPSGKGKCHTWSSRSAPAGSAVRHAPSVLRVSSRTCGRRRSLASDTFPSTRLDRQSDWWGKGVSVRLVLGGLRLIQKTNT